MDADQFDHLTARLSPVLTRRRSLGLLGALGVAGIATIDDASGKHKKKHKKKKKPACGTGTKVCGRECIASSSCCGSCPDGGFCRNGTCVVCTSEETQCDNVCVNLATDPNNCGRCGRTCPSGGCLNGACTCSEQAGIGCPSGCTCKPSAQGGGACAGVDISKPCDDNYLCALGEVCRAGSPSFCSLAC